MTIRRGNQGDVRLQAALEDRCRNLLAELGLLPPGNKISVRPLTGGVASDIAMVVAGDRTLCVKFALPKLKVAADWYAPVHRNAAEYAWLGVTALAAPASAIQLHGRSATLHGFAMEYLDGADTYLWKTELLAEAPDRNEAAQVGDLLGRIHAASTQTGFDVRAFQNRDDFRALRIEPYLTYTATLHPDIAAPLQALADRLYAADQVLVHGDVSPKNILFRASGPVMLDAECATMGDASFDPSFCLNHLVLKAIHLPGSRQRYLANVLDFWRAYAPSVGWEPAAAIESRVCELLPALMLARIDGKSPVEYLTDAERQIVRDVALQFINSPVRRLDELVAGIGTRLEEIAA